MTVAKKINYSRGLVKFFKKILFGQWFNGTFTSYVIFSIRERQCPIYQPKKRAGDFTHCTMTSICWNVPKFERLFGLLFLNPWSIIFSRYEETCRCYQILQLIIPLIMNYCYSPSLSRRKCASLKNDKFPMSYSNWRDVKIFKYLRNHSINFLSIQNPDTGSLVYIFNYLWIGISNFLLFCLFHLLMGFLSCTETKILKFWKIINGDVFHSAFHFDV